MGRCEVNVVGPAHQAIADIADESAGNVRCVQPGAASRAYLKSCNSVSGENRQVAVIGVHASPVVGSLIAPLRLRRGVQHPPDPRGGIKLLFQENLPQTRNQPQTPRTPPPPTPPRPPKSH